MKAKERRLATLVVQAYIEQASETPETLTRSWRA